MLRRVLEQAFGSREAANLVALRHLGGKLPLLPDTAAAPRELPLAALPAVELTGWDAPPPPEAVGQFAVPPDPAARFWSEVVDLYGHDLHEEHDGHATSDADPETDRTGPATATGPAGRYARRIDFVEGYSVFLVEDSSCDILLPSPGRDPNLGTCMPSEVAAGMRLVLLPGADRGHLLEELLAGWDERLGYAKPYFEGLYRRALDAAIARHGVNGVARLVRVDTTTVRDWQAGKRAPQNSPPLERLLKASGDEEAYKNRAAIRELFATVRGNHRLIGRELNAAVTECLSEDGPRPHLQRLEAMVGRDLQDLLAAVVIGTVQRVHPERVVVPRSRIGQLLDIDDPTLTHATDSRNPR
jgi:hypothetical protein